MTNPSRTPHSNPPISDPNPFISIGAREPEAWLAPAGTTKGRIQRALAAIALCLLIWLTYTSVRLAISVDEPLGPARLDSWRDLRGKGAHREFHALDANRQWVTCAGYLDQKAERGEEVTVLRNSYDGSLSLDICAGYGRKTWRLAMLWFWPQSFGLLYAVAIHAINMRRLANWRARQARRALKG